MNPANSPEERIRVAILDDHQSALDSYIFRLTGKGYIEVVGTANYGNDLEALLEGIRVDVLVLDVGVPNSEADNNLYPILNVLPRLRTAYPDMSVLVISMHDQPVFVKAVLDAGATGYILKDDKESIIRLAEAVTLVNTGGIFLSKHLQSVLGGKVGGGPRLSVRQTEALSLAAAYPNLSMQGLAARMNIAPSTLRNQLSKAYKQLHVRSRAAAIVKARSLGLITPYLPGPNLKS
ncbi:MAG: response regulator transcription factor [Anaerolineales bacterium]